jgi:hypothetical protein
VDTTEGYRRAATNAINSEVQSNDESAERIRLEHTYREVWDSTTLSQQFEVLGFMAPFVVVRRKSTGQKGTLTFQHHPRFYFDFTPGIK